MAMFVQLNYEGVVQVNDKYRLDASECYVTKGAAALTTVEIEPEAGAGYIDVYEASNKNWVLDYQYATDGVKVVSVRVGDGVSTETLSFSVTCLSVADDNLFSDDQDLFAYKHDIRRFVPDGKSSFLNFHRKAQKKIMEEFDERGLVDVNNNKLTKASVVDVSEVNAWSIALTAQLVYEDLSKKPDDMYMFEAKLASRDVASARDRAVIRLDFDGDGQIDDGEAVSYQSIDIVRNK